MNKKRSIGRRSNLEGSGPLFGQLSTQRDLKLLILFATDTSFKSRLPKAKKELFTSFREEQQRLNKMVAIKYLRGYLTEQRKVVNEMAQYLREREKDDNKKILADPKWRKSYKTVDISKISVPEFKLSHDMADLNNKILLLDTRLVQLRSKIEDYEVIDYERKNGDPLMNMIKGHLNRKIA